MPSLSFSQPFTVLQANHSQVSPASSRANGIRITVAVMAKPMMVAITMNRKVRICQVAWLSSQEPRSSVRFSTARITPRTEGTAVTSELAVFCGALIGAGLGFLWYNAPPAMVFMGDTGSLSMGGALGAISVITKHELVLVIIGGLFVLETVSVIVQVFSFKLTGRRVFRMAPLHHHFEKKGWQEPTIVIRFWIIAIILALIGLSTLKLR